MSKSKDTTEEFEKWFLKLNSDFSKEDLAPGRNGSYFYTATKSLYKQFVDIKRMKNIINVSHIECQSCGITILDPYNSDKCPGCGDNWITGEDYAM